MIFSNISFFNMFDSATFLGVRTQRKFDPISHDLNFIVEYVFLENQKHIAHTFVFTLLPILEDIWESFFWTIADSEEVYLDHPDSLFFLIKRDASVMQDFKQLYHTSKLIATAA